MALGSRSSQQASRMQEIILHPPKIGVVTFNSATAPTSGAACVAPKVVSYFNRRSEIASDVLWLSDAKDAVNAQNFRASNYLRSTLTQIAADLGVTLRGENTAEGLQAVAETVGRVRDIAAHAYEWMDFSTDWSYPDLATCIGKILPPTGEILQAMESPLAQAHQTYSSVPDRAYPEGNAQTIYTLRTNRLRYAQYICSTKVPNSAWISVPNVSQHNLKLDDFLDPDRPSLVEASIEFTTGLNEYVTPALTAFGSSKPMGKSRLRRWISQPELAWLVEHANVHISSAFLCQGAGESLSSRHALPVTLTADPVYALSIAAGLVAECHWVGLSNTTSVRRPGQSATARYVELATPTAVWLRAADRAYGFVMAKLLAQKGYIVTGYGYGSVSFFGPKDNVRQVMDLADELGTCHPCLAAMEQRMLVGQEVSSVEGVL